MGLLSHICKSRRITGAAWHGCGVNEPTQVFTAYLLSADLCHLLNETSLSSEEGTAQLMSQQAHLIKATPEGERLGGGGGDKGMGGFTKLKSRGELQSHG